MDRRAVDEPIKDQGSFAHRAIGDDDIDRHHSESWQHQAMNVGLHLPRRHKHRHHHKHKHHTPTKKHTNEEEAVREPLLSGHDSSIHPASSTSERIAYLLGSEVENEKHQPHDVFCEMEELRYEGEDFEWKEMARWVKFEEDVEEGGERWSKPHVASLSLHSLFELRKGMLTATLILDLEASDLFEIVDNLLEHMISSGQLQLEFRDPIGDVLMAKHRHQYQRDKAGMSLVRSMADIGKKHSSKNIEKEGMTSSHSFANRKASVTHLSTIGTAEGDLSRTGSHGKFNEHFLKKLPPGAEAANILIGEVEFLPQSIMALIRLGTAIQLGDLTEVPIPTKFIFVLLGPKGHMDSYHEIGRSIGTLLSDEVFHEIAYKAENRTDFVHGMDEFLDQVTVLPPGEWDPNIRIEPPKSVPSQEPRKHGLTEKDLVPTVSNGIQSTPAEEKEEIVQEEEGHSDPTLERTGRLFGGLINDIKRKLPWYLSDFTDGVHIQCLASFFFIYFACLTPIITFGGLLGEATGNNMAAMESLISGAICGITWHMFSGQPLTIVGSTGPVLVFETIVYNFCQSHHFDYLSLRFWIGAWLALFLFIMVMFDLSALVRYITRFTEESFALLIALIFIVEAFKKLLHILDYQGVILGEDYPLHDYHCCNPPGPHGNDSDYDENSTAPYASVYTTTLSFVNDTFNSSVAPHLDYESQPYKQCKKVHGLPSGPGCRKAPDVFFFSCLLFIGTFSLSIYLKNFRNTRFFPAAVRSIISDFAVVIAICSMVGLDAIVGLATPKLLVPTEVKPTLSHERGWLINPFKNPVYTIPAACLPAILATILIFMDQQITVVIINRKEHKLRKGGGYHLDLLLIAVQIFICSLMGTPWFVAATVLSINHVRSLSRESETSAPGERPKFLGIREQRMTGTLVFVMVGLSALMSKVLKHIPMPVLFGVFLFMGISSMKGIQAMQRFFLMFMPAKYQPDYVYMRHVPLRRAHLFTCIQILCLACLWVIKSLQDVSIIFPVMVLAMCFVRKLLDYVFTRHELKWLDDILPESHKKEKEDKEDKKKTKNGKDQSQVFEMKEGMLRIPGRDGTIVSIPISKLTYDPKSKEINLSDDVTRSAIWKHFEEANQPAPPYSQLMRSSIQGDQGTSKPVRFHIDEDDNSLRGDNPQIVIDPASARSSKENISRL